jgi:hypothetical protein
MEDPTVLAEDGRYEKILYVNIHPGWFRYRFVAGR